MNQSSMNNIIIVANWKMNPQTLTEAQELFEAVAKGVKGVESVEVVICPPFVYIPEIQNTLRSNSGRARYKIQVGAQDCFWEEKGAYTGEVSPSMMKDLGCSYVIVGHSERKKYLGETEDMVQQKVAAALAAGLKVVLCVGENEETPSDMPNLLVVYEPEWAISSEGGEAADLKTVALKVAEMRGTLKTTPILYGGSVDSSNIASFLKETGVQGALVGSSSLKAQEFIALVKNAVLR